jgi:hypothetical protein
LASGCGPGGTLAVTPTPMAPRTARTICWISTGLIRWSDQALVRTATPAPRTATAVFAHGCVGVFRAK